MPNIQESKTDCKQKRELRVGDIVRVDPEKTTLHYMPGPVFRIRSMNSITSNLIGMNGETVYFKSAAGRLTSHGWIENNKLKLDEFLMAVQDAKEAK